MQTPAIVDAEAALANTLNVNLTATSVPGRITLTWNAVPGAMRYQVERDGTQVDNQLNRTFVHSNLAVDSLHIYRVRAQVNGAYGKWTYRVLKAASNEPVVQTLQPAVEPPRDANGQYLPDLNELYEVGKPGQPVDSPALHQGRHRGLRRPEPELRAAVSEPRIHRRGPGRLLDPVVRRSERQRQFNSDSAGGDFGFKIDQIEYVQ